MLSYYFGDLRETVRLAREAQAIGGRAAASATALAAAAEARALARDGDRPGSESAMREAQRLFAGIPDSDRTDIALNFSERRLYLYLSGALTFLGERRRAAEAQQQALQLYPEDAAGIDRALIRLDQATCMAQDHAVEDACQLAESALLTLPLDQRAPIVLARAHALLTSLPHDTRRLGPVRQLRETLALKPTTA
jgi:tetratricopeptide (TPR) repeat protein